MTYFEIYRTKVEYQLSILTSSLHFHFIISFTAANMFRIAYCAQRFDPISMIDMNDREK